MKSLIGLLKAYISAGMPCLFHATTGLYCPGCGGRRALYYLLHGQLLLSAIYHPLVLYCAVLAAYLLLRHLWHRIARHPASAPISFLKPWMLWEMLVVIFGNFLVKNIALIAFHIDLLI